MYYTYAYLREDNTPYYIGMGKGMRIHKSHNRGCQDIKPPLGRRVKLTENLTREGAIEEEIRLISFYGRKDNGTGILRNMTDGGEGQTGAVDTSKFASYGTLGKTMPQSQKDKLHKYYTDTFELTNKDGRVIIEKTTLKQLAEDYCLNRSTLYKVMKGVSKYQWHKGWKVKRLSQSGKT